MTDATHSTPVPRLSLQDRMIALLVRFFRAEWSGALLAIVILGLAIEVATTDTMFFRPSNLMTILNNSAAIGVVAGGMTLIILTAGIDLSVGSVMGLTAALTGYVASFWGFPPALAILTGLGIGLAVGAFNGTLVAYFGMPAFIVTLAGLSIWRGTGHLTTNAQATPKLPEAFDYFGRYNPFAGLRQAYRDGELTGIWENIGAFVDANWLNFFRTFQMSMLIFIAFFLVLSIVVANTRYGRYVYAIGSNEPGARQAGINTRRYTLMTYMFGSFAAAFGALLFLGRAPYAKSDYGQMWELDAIAAVVIGGTSLFGGRGSLWGTFMGVILLKLINNGLTLAQLNTFWQMVVTGGIILVAVGIDIVRQSRDPEAVRKLLATVGAFMAFLTLMTPASVWLRAKISLGEHAAAMALREAGDTLAPGHTARLMEPEAIQAAQLAAQSTLVGTLVLLVLTILAAVNIFRGARPMTLVLAAGFVVMIPVVALMGYQAATPFLVLGACALAASAFVFTLFERARSLSHD
ncbi:ABC transporter permease [Pseudooceanicola onchidii]|uniref:ABC transporter permease n=1 Tax=Pseudooceanicola onchidii TaxID=2562279 RepID=UPI0010AA2FFB|nr:ABC transporter permease [Pseudooceanicola onchidii]